MVSARERERSKYSLERDRKRDQNMVTEREKDIERD